MTVYTHKCMCVCVCVRVRARVCAGVSSFVRCFIVDIQKHVTDRGGEKSTKCGYCLYLCTLNINNR